MYYRCFIVLTILLFSGCAGIDGKRLSERSSDLVDSTGEVIRNMVTRPDEERFEQQRNALFDQPYIDPLTDYLQEHGDDSERESVLRQIAQERDRRCRAIAARYDGEPATGDVLARYRAGYDYSCPEQVAAFARQVEREQPQPVARPTETAPQSESGTEPQQADNQSLSDCYLLTSIRNYSAAREACRKPAKQGDVKSQANMALIAHAFEDYDAAYHWARKAAPDSVDASYLLGRMYASGRGVEQNPDQAVYWYKQAAGHGHKEARSALDRHRENASASGT